MAGSLTDDSVRAMRGLWFDYLDAIAAARPKLHAYCLALTGQIWDAEDLVQETLVRGFGAIGRADMHGARMAPWFDEPRAYLAQIATNLWIDRWRRLVAMRGSFRKSGSLKSRPR